MFSLLCKEHQRLLKKESMGCVSLHQARPRMLRQRAAASQRTAERGGAVHAHDSPREGAHPKGVKGHPALRMHRKSKALSNAGERIFIIRGCG